MKPWRVLALTLSIFTINLIGITSANADYALTSIPFPNGKEVTGVTVSNDGTQIAVASSGNGIYTSTDSGASWVNRTSALSPQPGWTSIVSSADGRYIAASAFLFPGYVGGVYVSSDFGLTWNKTLTPAQGGIASIAMSSDGSKIIAALSSGGSTGVTSIYRSSNSGATWSNTITEIPALARTGNFFELTISDDGVHIAASYSSNDWAVRGFIISANSGASWTEVTSGIPAGLARIAASGDGSKIAYQVSGNPIYFSNDYGVNWTTSSWPTGGSNGLRMSNDGNVVVQIKSGSSTDTLYVSMDGGATRTTQILSPGGMMNRWQFTTNRIGTKIYLTRSYSLIYAVDLIPAVTIPGAPIVGTATALSPTSASISFSLPTSNGGATITSYTATSTPGSLTGTVSQSGSGSITINGLTASTPYTFRVTATNSVGTSSASTATVSITMPASQAEIAAAALAAKRALEAKREAEKQAARLEIVDCFSESITPTLIQFNTAEIYGVTKNNINNIITDVNYIIIDESATALLRDESATVLNQEVKIKPVIKESINTIMVVEKVVKKYVILDWICQPGTFSQFYASDLSSVGLILKKYQTIITYNLRQLSIDQRDDYAKIDDYIVGQHERYQYRDRQIASLATNQLL